MAFLRYITHAGEPAELVLHAQNAIDKYQQVHGEDDPNVRTAFEGLIPPTCLEGEKKLWTSIAVNVQTLLYSYPTKIEEDVEMLEKDDI